MDDIERLISTIRRLPSDQPVATGTPGYNNYTTQKDHWLGWLDPKSTRGSYPRRAAPGRDAKYVYNHIGEPKMLLWLASAAGVMPELIRAAEDASSEGRSLATRAAAIRRHIPWSVVAAAMWGE